MPVYRRRPRRRRIPRIPRRKITGRGFYKGFGSDFGNFFGGAVSKLTGIPGLAKAGGWLGGRAAKITGFGSYAGMDHSNAGSRMVLPNNPRISNAVKFEGGVIVNHREYIGDVSSSIGFANQYVLPLNPAMPASFPWLSGTAANFQQYIPMGVVYEYVSSSGSAVSSTNNALGSVMMSCQYNSLDTDYTTKAEMLNENFAQCFAPSANGALPIECAASQTTLNKLYTRHGAVEAGGDLRMYDLGKVTIATQGMQAADIVVGSLYVNYQFALLKPQLGEGIGELAATASYSISSSVTDASPLSGAASPPTRKYDNMGLTFVNSNIQIPKNTVGKFLLSVFWIGSSVTVAAPSLVLVNATRLTILGQIGTEVSQFNSANLASTICTLEVAFEIDESSLASTVSFLTDATLPTSITTAGFTITQLNKDVATVV